MSFSVPTNLTASQVAQGSLNVNLSWSPSYQSATSPQLLLHMDGQNGTNLFNDSSGNGIVATPSGVTVSTTAPKYGSGCANFSGGGKYLSMPIVNAGLLDLESIPAWTVEGWFQIPAGSSISGNLNILFSDYSAAAGSQYIRIYISGSGYAGTGASVQLACAGGGASGSVSGPSSVVINDGNWHHFAVCANKATGLVQVFVDGISGTPSTSYAGFTNSNPNSSCFIGTDYPTLNGGPQNYFEGYIDDFRITASAIYTGNFVPPTQALGLGVQALGYDVYRADVGSIATFLGGTTYEDMTPPAFGSYTYSVAAWGPNDANTSLLLHMDGANGSQVVPDTSGNNWGVNAIGVSLSTSQQKYGTASLACGTGALSTLFTSGSSLDLTGGGDFTVEFWFYESGTNNSTALLSIGIPGSSGFYFGFNSSGQGPEVFSNSTTVAPATLAVPSAGWHHVALVVHSGSATLYLDGVGGTAVGSWGATQTGSGQLCIGAKQGASFPLYSGYFVGYIDEVRVSKTARYTSNFTPSGPFTAASADLTAQSSPFTINVTNVFVVPQCVFVGSSVYTASVSSNLSGAPDHIYSAPDYTTVQAK